MKAIINAPDGVYLDQLIATLLVTTDNDTHKQTW